MSVAGFVTSCRKANLPQLEAILKQNPKLINAKNDKGRTGLMMAAYEAKAQVAEALLKNEGKAFSFINVFFQNLIHVHVIMSF